MFCSAAITLIGLCQLFWAHLPSSAAILDQEFFPPAWLVMNCFLETRLPRQVVSPHNESRNEKSLLHIEARQCDGSMATAKPFHPCRVQCQWELWWPGAGSVGA